MQVELRDLASILTPVICGIVGWGVRLIWSEIKGLREELREYVRQETCAAHRASLELQIKDALSRALK